MRWLLIAAFFIGCCYNSSGGSSFTPAWQTLDIGGGGLANNIQVATSDGTIVHSENVYGAYLYRATGTCAGASTGGWGTSNSAPCWEQLFTQTSAPLTLTQVTGLNQGVLEIDSCNNNTNDAYAFTEGNLWVTTTLKSAASLRTWARTPLTNSIGGNQGISAGTGRAIACDPANPNVVYAATPAGVNVSADGLSGTGASFAVISTSKIGTTGAIPSAIAFDPTSSSGTCSAISGSPTCTLHFWILTSGHGVYETYNGGTTFTLTTGGPTTATSGCGGGGYCFELREDAFGNVFAMVGDGKLYKYTPNGTAGGGTWSSSTPLTNNNAAYFALDPTSGSAGTQRIAASSADGNLSVTTNGGSTWTSFSGNSWAASSPQPVWMGNAAQESGGLTFLDAQDLTFDTSGNLRAAAGIGIWEITSGNVSVTATWQADSVGIESLVANYVDTPPGSSPIVAVWDRGFFLLKNPDVYPAHYWADKTLEPSFGAINGGWGLDWSSATPSTLVGWAAQDNTAGASSSDGGNTWTLFPNFPGSVNTGGAVAATSGTDWLLVPGSGNLALAYTTDGATSAWTSSTVSGETLPWATSSVFVTSHVFPLAADRITASTYCAVDAVGNFFKSTNNGSSFSLVAASGTTDQGTYNYGIKSVPGEAGTFIFSAGNDGGGATGQHLWISTNTCATWTKINANFTDVFAFGIGATPPNGSFPAVYAYGELNGVIGLYESDNANLGLSATWSLINVPAVAQIWPNNSSDFVTAMAGDNNVYGRVYVGFNSSGYAYIDTQNACPWVNFSNVNPNASLTGTINLTAQHSGLVPVSGVSFYVDGTLIGTQTTGSGTPTTYTQSWNTSGVSHGSHTLTVTATGNCSTYGSFSIPITTSMLLPGDFTASNDNSPVGIIGKAA